MKYVVPFLIVISAVFIQPFFVFGAENTVSFFVEPSFDISGRSQISATLRYSGKNAEFFVEDLYYQNLTGNALVDFIVDLKELSDEFDGTIYPEMRDLYGSEWTPGIDGNVKISVLLTPMKNETRGYFREQNEVAQSVESTSNEREMVYLSSSLLGSELAKSWFAHEFQHLINYYQKKIVHNVSEARWLNEALSEYASTSLGYNSTWEGSYLKTRAEDFLNLPLDSLLSWNDSPQDYASANLFLHYLAGQFGNEVLKGIIQSSQTGVDAINEALSSYESDFTTLFTDWGITNFLNNITAQDGDRYSYKIPSLWYGNFHVKPRATFNMIAGQPSNASFALSDWQTDYFTIRPSVVGPTGSNMLKVQFDGADENTNFAVSYVQTDILGKNTVHKATVDSKGDTTLSFPGFGTKILSLTLIISSQYNLQGTDGALKSFSITSELSRDEEASYVDGSLLKAIGDPKVYVINGDTKRWIQSPEIFNGYGHLKWEDIIEVTQEILNQYEESFLVIQGGDYKVYEVDVLGNKQWLNMTGATFSESGRRWDAIYVINENEFNWYKMGSDILS